MWIDLESWERQATADGKPRSNLPRKSWEFLADVQKDNDWKIILSIETVKKDDSFTHAMSHVTTTQRARAPQRHASRNQTAASSPYTATGQRMIERRLSFSLGAS